MKILFIIPHYYPAVSFGGPPIVVHELAKALTKERVEVSIFTGNALDLNHRISERYANIDGVNVYYFKELSTHMAYRWNFYATPAFFVNLMGRIREFDLVHIHELYSVQNLFAGILASQSMPFIISPHGSLTESPMKGKAIFKKLFYFMSRNVYKKAQKFIALTEKEKTECHSYGIPIDKISIIPNGISVPQTVSYQERKLFQNKWKIPSHSQIILYMGRLHRIKHLDLLIESFAVARRKDPEIFLVIAGPDGGVKKDLENIAYNLLPSNSYLFTGVVKDSEKNNLLGWAKISILTSHSEGLSQFALESSSFGIPLISTRSAGQDFITKYSCGWEVSENSGDISKNMIKLLHDKESYSQFSKNGKRMTEKNYSWESVAKKYKELYNSVCERNIS